MQRDIMPMSKDMNIVQEPEIIGEELIKDFITPGNCRLLFDQQDLRYILFNYQQLGYIDIEDLHFGHVEHYVEHFLKSRNNSDILALFLINGGDKREIMDSLGRSSLSNRGIMCFYAHSNTLSQSTSLRIYFFDKSMLQENTTWRDKINKAVRETRSSRIV